jgi:hypothetical protein
MSADDFFSRWSKRKAQDPVPPETIAAPAAAPAPELPPPTLEELAGLGHDADFRRFVQPGVDEEVRRSAMKKLFTDPHFNVMDGLDIYIDDYNKFEPIPPAMLAMLAHAKPLLDPLGHLQQQPMTMLDQAQQLAAAQPTDAALADKAQEDLVPAISDQPGEPGQAGDHPAVDQTDQTDQTDKQSAAQADNAAEPPNDTAAPEDEHTI